MAPIITTAKIMCKSKEARVTVLEAFHKIIGFTQPSEPDVLRYVVTLPIDDTLGTDLYMIEEYASQAASDAHIATAPVQDLIKLFTTGDVLASPPEVHHCAITSNKICPTIPLSSTPAIILAHFQYKPSALSHALKGWANVVDYVTKNEHWTYGYTVSEDKETSSVRTVEVYESWEFLEKVHMKNEAIGEDQKQNGKDRTGVKGVVRVRAVDGFMGREGGHKL